MRGDYRRAYGLSTIYDGESEKECNSAVDGEKICSVNSCRISIPVTQNVLPPFEPGSVRFMFSFFELAS